VIRFEFATAARILFGPGCSREIGPLARELAAAPDESRAFVVTGRTVKRVEGLIDLLRAHGVECTLFAVPHEPTVELIRSGVAVARATGCRVVVGIGGGSAIDAAKAIAALLTNPGDVFDYLEVIGRGRPLAHPAVPCIAVPTTAGTGAEVTRNAVLLSTEHRVKVSMRSPLMLPRVAVVDPELTYDLPPAITASTGMDALTQLVEPFVSTRANPMIDAVCREGLRRVGRSLLRAYRDGRDACARTDMSLASLFGGLALANAGLGAVHGLAGPIGGMFPAPHGAVCAALLAHVMAANVLALRKSRPDAETLRRYHELGPLLTGHPDADAEGAVEWVRQVTAQLGIPPLRSYGLREEDLPGIVEKAQAASSMKANPAPLGSEELRSLLAAAI